MFLYSEVKEFLFLRMNTLWPLKMSSNKGKNFDGTYENFTLFYTKIKMNIGIHSTTIAMLRIISSYLQINLTLSAILL